MFRDIQILLQTLYIIPKCFIYDRLTRTFTDLRRVLVVTFIIDLIIDISLQKSQTKGKGCGNHGGSEIIFRGGRPREATTGTGPKDARGFTAGPRL